MINNLYKLLYKHKDKKTYLYVYRFIKLFLNIFYPIYCKFINFNKYKLIEKDVIVSLTSFPSRIESVWLTIETLLRQTYRPEKIILWLAETQFDSLESLPKKLLNQQARGLEIKFCDDLRSHKKYYYTMKSNPDAVVITVDDDTFYPEDMIGKLLDTHRQFPNTICCNLGHLMVVNDGEVAPYINWISGADGYDQPSHYLVPIGCEGVLYPPGCLNPRLFDKKLIQELCPLADDLWLKAMSTLNGIKAVKTNATSITYANLLTAKKRSLNKTNVEQNMNDKQLNKILDYFPKLKNIWK